MYCLFSVSFLLIPPTTLLLYSCLLILSFFSSNTTPTTEIYTLSLHDALPISERPHQGPVLHAVAGGHHPGAPGQRVLAERSEEHTSELQSLRHLVCRLLLEKKKKLNMIVYIYIIMIIVK